MKTAFITGGTGFLGLNLIEALSKEDWEIYALHRKSSDLTYLKGFKANLVEGSIRDYTSLLAGMPENADAVFHVAGNTALWHKRNEEQYQDNVIGTRNMVNAALEKKTKRFIHTSSIAAFGTHDTKIDEKTLSNAENALINYDKTKFLAEKEVDKTIEKGLNAVILNPCHIVGAYDTHNWTQLLQLTYRQKLPGIPPGSGMYGYVKDIAQAHIQAVTKGEIGERYLLGGVEASFLDVVNVIQKILGRKPYRKATPKSLLKIALYLGKLQSLFSNKEPTFTLEKYLTVTKKMLCDYQKAVQVLGYQSSSLEIMIGECFDWLKKENLL